MPTIADLLDAFGPSRLVWGADYPFVLDGAFPLPEVATTSAYAMTYREAAWLPAQWSAKGFDAEAYDAMMGGNAVRMFGF